MDHPRIVCYNKFNYCIMNSVFSDVNIDYLLNHTPMQDPSKRAKWDSSVFHGAIPTFNNDIKSDAIVYRNDRLDWHISETQYNTNIKSFLDNSGVTALLEKLVRRGSYRTMNIMYVPPGSKEQEPHMDQEEGDYATVLIPLIRQTHQTGGTRVFIGNGYIDFVEPLLMRGDALIFSGKLKHLGMANKSGVDRYIFYASFSNKKDKNVY
jgi:hypothetical protein